MNVTKLIVGTIVALAVFAVGEIPLLFVPTDSQGFPQLRPNFLGFEPLASAGVLSGLCLLCSRARRPLLQGASVGVLAGLLVSLSDQPEMYKDSLDNPGLFIPIVVRVEIWHFTVWAAAGAAVAWLNERIKRRAAA